MLRKIQSSDMIGKRIQSIKNDTANVLKITFDDNSTLELWAEDTVYTEYGNIPGIYVETEPD